MAKHHKKSVPGNSPNPSGTPNSVPSSATPADALPAHARHPKDAQPSHPEDTQEARPSLPEDAPGVQPAPPDNAPDADGSGPASAATSTPVSTAASTDAATVGAPSDSMAPSAQFPVVGIGASAGGLAAIEAFFSAVPGASQTGMAFVVVQHLDPDHKSILMDLIRQYTKMTVLKIEDGMEVLPDCVYVIPPNCDLAFQNGRLHLLDPGAPRGLRLPIDFFFRSLAQDQHERAICVVLSGTGTDGTLGLKEVKGEGGMAMAQAPESAAYDGMPRSAIATGVVDYVLPPGEMPGQLIAYVRHAFGHRLRPAARPALHENDMLHKVFVILRSQTGHDFSLYKPNTIRRRVERRMAVAQIDRTEDYVHYLRENALEVETLFRELLIGVTSFFRDAQAFESLRENVLPRLFANPAGGEVRAWVTGCSSGEEAYSIAILMREYLDRIEPNFQVQIFATDIDAKAIERARAGVYPDNIAADVSPERLARFFTPEDNARHISKTIRDMVIFAKQDILKDPPFSKLDLISCRNLLIYLGAEAQKKILPLFHYALNPDGFLFLGNSETVGDSADLFGQVDKRWRIYNRQGLATHPAIPAYVPPNQAEPIAPPGRQPVEIEPNRAGTARHLAEQVLLDTFAPAGVLVNAESEILYVHGHTGKYLEPAVGEPSLNLLSMAREGLRMELTSAVRKALVQQTPVRYEGLRVKSNGDTTLVNLLVQPVTRPETVRGLLMVIFEEAPPVPVAAVGTDVHPVGAEHEERLAALERELRTKGEYLQTTVEELETTNEELQSANEELQSANEELQSTNEELETSKEELQSVNEELTTVNTELQKKIEEISRANNDMNNLLAGTNIGTLFLDHRLHIQRFTPSTTQVISLIPTDVGRPVADIVSRLRGYDSLVEDSRTVLATLVPQQAEVQARDNKWYQMRIQPYRTLENVIEGVVVTFVEITEARRMATLLQQQGDLTAAILDLSAEGIVVHNDAGRCVFYNRQMEAATGYPKPDGDLAAFHERLLPDAADRERAAAAVRAAMAGEPVESQEWQILRKDGTKRTVRVALQRLAIANGFWLAETMTNVSEGV